jgi:hypothetical protein
MFFINHNIKLILIKYLFHMNNDRSFQMKKNLKENISFLNQNNDK